MKGQERGGGEDARIYMRKDTEERGREGNIRERVRQYEMARKGKENMGEDVRKTKRREEKW